MEEEFENNDSTNVEEENDDSTNVSEETSEVVETEDVETLKEQNKKLFARAKKAEGFIFKDGEWIKKPKSEIVEKKPEAKEPVKQQGLSTIDTIALIKANVNTDDIPEVEEYAKFKGISVAEALNTSVIKTLLAEKEEKRNTAEVTNTKTTRRSPSKPDEAQILEDAQKGKFPADASELAKARTAKLLAQLKNNN